MNFDGGESIVDISSRRCDAMHDIHTFYSAQTIYMLYFFLLCLSVYLVMVDVECKEGSV